MLANSYSVPSLGLPLGAGFGDDAGAHHAMQSTVVRAQSRWVAEDLSVVIEQLASVCFESIVA
jgi:hypothetical protein